jgi:DNA polymerase III epsilon subunit-like protein
MQRLLIVDTETTDFLANDPEAEIVEIAAAVLDLQEWRVLGFIHSLVAHSRPMSAFTAKNFADTTFVDNPPLDYVLESLFNMWETYGGAWFGQNPDFDFSFIKPAAKRLGLAWPQPPKADYHVMDLGSMMLPYVLRGECESVSLRHSRKWARIPGQQSHRAKGDVIDVIGVLSEVIARSHETKEQRARIRESAAGALFKLLDAKEIRT